MNAFDSNGAVFGNGMLAHALKQIQAPRSNYFAAGVSDSNSVNEMEFQRELSTIQEFIDVKDRAKITYFSSFVAIDGDSRYAEHKRAMEAIVKNSAFQYNIIRLPQVVGLSSNNTLICHFVRKISQGLPLILQTEARRRLVAIDDVVRISDLIARQADDKLTINVGPHLSLSPLAIAKQIGEILKIAPILNFVEGGDDQLANLDAAFALLGKKDILFLSDYQRMVLEKNVPLLHKRLCS